MTRLGYTDRWHQYTLDGKRVPSVTKITGAALAKPGMVYAAAREAATWAKINHDALGTMDEAAWIKSATMAHREVWAKSATDGKQLHKLAESMVLGEPMPLLLDGEPVPEHVADMAGQLARFFDAWSVEPVAVESMCFHEKFRYAGRWDLVAQLADGNRWLLDYKTGASGIYQESALQLAAYRYATHYVTAENEDKPTSELYVSHGGAVWIRPDTWELRPVRCDRPMFNYFLHAGALADFASLDRDSVVDPALARPVAS